MEEFCQYALMRHLLVGGQLFNKMSTLFSHYLILIASYMKSSILNQ